MAQVARDCWMPTVPQRLRGQAGIAAVLVVLNGHHVQEAPHRCRHDMGAARGHNGLLTARHNVGIEVKEAVLRLLVAAHMMISDWRVNLRQIGQSIMRFVHLIMVEL